MEPSPRLFNHPKSPLDQMLIDCHREVKDDNADAVSGIFESQLHNNSAMSTVLLSPRAINRQSTVFVEANLEEMETPLAKPVVKNGLIWFLKTDIDDVDVNSPVNWFRYQPRNH